MMPTPRSALTVAALGVALLAAGCYVETSAPPPAGERSEPKPTGFTLRGGGPTGTYRTFVRPAVLRTARATTRPATGPAGLVGKPVPKFQMTDLKGNHLTPESLKGKVVLIDLWATWCPPCRAASPILQQLHEKYGERGLVVIGANMAERDKDGKPIKTKDAAEKYSREHKLTYTFTYGNEDFAGACHVRGIPTMLVLDRKGVVRKVQVGFDADLFKIVEKEIAPLLDATN